MRTGRTTRTKRDINQLTMMFMGSGLNSAGEGRLADGASQLASIRAQIRIFILEHFSEKLDGAHDISHLDRVWSTARELGIFYDADLKILLATAYLHDIFDGKSSSLSYVENKKICDMLCVIGYSSDEIEQIENDAMSHRFSKGIVADSIEGKILQDADRLDAIGCIGIARVFYFAGRSGAKILHPDEPFAESRPIDDKKFAVDHFDAKLLGIPGRMNTKKAMEMAQTRLKFMKSFLKSLRTEVAEPIGS